jgi:hypothetical protein
MIQAGMLITTEKHLTMKLRVVSLSLRREDFRQGAGLR